MGRRALSGLMGMMALQLATTAPAAAFNIPVPYDKAAHFGLSYVIADQLMRTGMPPDEALAWTLAIGWIKEMSDPVPDPGDMAADAAGALAARFLRLEWRF